MSKQAFSHFTQDEGETIEAAMARIFPSDERPGASEARAVVYVDRALAGAESEYQPLYRAGIRLLDSIAEVAFGACFRRCSASEQDEALQGIQSGIDPETGLIPAGQVFFDLLRAHTLEGLFSDPVHGGNQDLIGWKLLDYPGPQPSFTHDEQQLNAVVRRDRIYTAADYPLPETDPHEG